MDDPQQHLQGQAKAINPFRRGDRVRLNARAAGQWGRRKRMVAYVVEEPGDYLVPVMWVKQGSPRDELVRAMLVQGPIIDDGGIVEAFHFLWLDPAPADAGGAT